MSRVSHLSPVELLELGDADRVKPWLNKYWPEMLGVTFGILTGVFINFATRRPSFSGIQKHIIGTAGWAGILKYAQYKRDDYLMEKDAVLRHYISLHKEEFRAPEMKKIGDIFEPWVPIR